jgi:hypothetical protein
VDEAVAEYRAAIRLKPDYAEAHCNLAHILRDQGQFAEALDEERRGHELGSKHPDWPYPSLEWVRESERLFELEAKLPGILKGTTKLDGTHERIDVAGICSLKRLNRAAARFYEEAFVEDAKLANDLDASHRYNAACAAALAGCGQGKDGDNLDGKERARLGRQALDWLRADLEAWKRLLDTEPDKARSAAEVTKVLEHWLVDPDLRSVRGPQALAKLPEAERLPWQSLWDGVAATLASAQSLTTPKKQPGAK